MTADLDGTAEFLTILSYLLDRAGDPGLGMLDDLKTLLGLVQDDSERFYGNNQKGITPYAINSFYGDGNAPTYLADFYGFLDEITEEVTTLSTPGIGPERDRHRQQGDALHALQDPGRARGNHGRHVHADLLPEYRLQRLRRRL